MAENKKSVLLYCDLIHTVEKMDNETAGEFFKHYLRYINDLDPVTENVIVDITFESVKQNLKRDLKKWEDRAERSRLNGKLGGRPKTQKTQQVNSEPKKPVNDTVTVTDTVTGNVNVNDKKEKGENRQAILPIPTDSNVQDKDFDTDVIDCFENCLKYFPEKFCPKNEKQNFAWKDEIRKLHQIDGHPYELIEHVCMKVRENDFWSSNVLSMLKMRKTNPEGIKYFDVLIEALKSPDKSNSTYDRLMQMGQEKKNELKSKGLID